MREPDDQLRTRVLATLGGARGGQKPKELAHRLRVPRHEYRAFRRLLQGMEKSGAIRRIKGHRYVATAPRNLVTGKLSLTRRGDGFVRPEGGGEDVFVPGRDLGTAMEGDRVSVSIERHPRGRSREGKVVDVLERALETVVGTFHRVKRVSFVVPISGRLEREIRVPGPGDTEASDGDVVVVRMLTYGDRRSRPTGEIEKVLGPLSDPGVDVLAVAHAFGLSMEFSPDVLAAAREAAEAGRAATGERVDRTGLLCFTIDPADAKDHDDALSISLREDGLAEIGVHIADVSHFVTPLGVVDLEARSRGTSVYLVDRAIPMLPEMLSSDVCSLMVDEPRLAMSLFVTLGRDGTVHERRYERTTIRCRHALSYEEAQAVLDGRASVAPDVDEALRQLDDHARGVRAARTSRGSLDLDIPEADVILGEDGVPTDIQRRSRHATHRLVEDFMILANEVVAQDLEARGVETLFRVHEAPEAERVADLAEVLAPLGIAVPSRTRLKPADIQALLDAPRSPEAHTLVSTLVLRALKKARYDTENVGHFGLASTGYTHFTSPIRRYPDLVVHRVLACEFLGGAPMPPGDEGSLASVAEHASERERAAEEAERATVQLKKVEFMERHLGDSFAGRVTGVAPFGVFVTLDDFFVEGLVHVRSLEDDFYEFNAGGYALIGARNGRSFTLGDRLEVQVTRVDKEARHIDFLALRKISGLD